MFYGREKPCVNSQNRNEQKFFLLPFWSQNNVSQTIKLYTNGKMRLFPEIWLSTGQARVDRVVQELGGTKGNFNCVNLVDMR